MTFLRKYNLDRNIYTVLVLRLLLVMFLFSICRVGFYLFNASYFPGMTPGRFLTIMKGGLLFDLSAILYTNLLIILLHLIPFPFRYHRMYQKVVSVLFYMFNGIALAANVGDFVYYPFTLKRTTSGAFEQFEHETNLLGIFLRAIYDYWYAFLFFVALILLMVYLYRYIRLEKPSFRFHLLVFVKDLALLAVCCGLIVAGVRGGFRHSTRPITLSNAGKYVDSPNEMAIVLNTPFCIYRTSEQDVLPELHYFRSEDELSRIYTPVHRPDSTPMKKMNVVIFIIESFATEYIGTFNRHLENGTYRGYTPFLDSLMNGSRVFWYSFSNGRKSIDAMPSVISSIPSVNQHFILGHYSGNRVSSLAHILNSEGYHTSFFHGAPNGSMGFESYAKLAGFQHYYGKNEYGNNKDFDGMWGIWDEEFFQFFAHTLDTITQPFFSTIFSVSSHHPFKVPEKYAGKFPAGTLPIHACVSYTDYALKQFFKTASRMPWFTNTLFVITADHASVIYYPEYRNLVGYFKIPIIFYQPGSDLKGFDDRVAQQLDIFPTLLDYLHYNKEYIAFGEDLFQQNPAHPSFAINYMFDTYQFISGDYALHFDGKKVIGLYRFKEDRLLEHNLAGTEPEVENQMLLRLKAFLQQYNNRMIGDSLTIKE
jgi:phosphoglycerol transferase MdoB-like AlkP superfamily enzyme